MVRARLGAAALAGDHRGGPGRRHVPAGRGRGLRRGVRLRRRRHRDGGGHRDGRAAGADGDPAGRHGQPAGPQPRPPDQRRGAVPADRRLRPDPRDRRGGGRGPQVRRDGRPRLRRRGHAGRPGGTEEEGRLAGVRRVGDQAPARARHPGDDHDRRRHAAAPAGAHRRRRQRRQAAGQHPAAARCAAGRRGARRGRDLDPQRPRLGPGRGSGGASGATCRTAGWSASPASTC